jgi:mannose-6-phosphate isomerase-like protein (cupin superfamily)
MLSGVATIEIDGEQRKVGPGDLIHIPRNALHSIWPEDGGSLRALSFAVSFMPPGSTYTAVAK